MTPTELLNVCNARLATETTNIYGQLSLVTGKVWSYIRGNRSPYYNYFKLDNHGNVYSPSGSVPLFNLDVADAEHIMKHGNHAYSYRY